tara:strand:+ start:1225 stop:1998 length:774 start_codon:yes stop_codon:yes gene_type:complete
MIDKSENKNFTNEVESHFDAKALNDNLEDFVPHCINDYLRHPYDYINDLYCKNLDDKIVLDYCCGTGINSVIFSKNGAKIKGIDISRDSIDKAKKKFKKHNLNNYEFYKMDAHSLNFEDNYFDYIICYKSLLYLNLEKSFKELNRVLKQDGKIIILENIGDNFIFYYYRFFKHISKSKKYASELNKIKTKNFNIAYKYFKCEESQYFDFFTIFGKLIKDKLKIVISFKFLRCLDYFLLNKLKISFLSFTLVKILKKK